MPTNNRPVRSHSRRGDYGKPLARQCEGFQKRESGASSFVCRQHGTAPKVSWAPNSFLESFFGHPIKLIGSSERRKRGKRIHPTESTDRPHERHLTFDKLFPGNTLTGYRGDRPPGRTIFPPPIVNTAEKVRRFPSTSRNRKRVIISGAELFPPLLILSSSLPLSCTLFLPRSLRLRLPKERQTAS